MNVVIVMPLAEMRGGSERALLDLLQEGRNKGVVWRVIFLEDGPMVGTTRALGIVTEIVQAGRMRQIGRFGAAILEIARLLRQWRAHVVLGWLNKAQLYAAPAASLARVPALWFQMGLASANNGIDRAATRLPARGILTCSEFGAQAQARLRPARPVRAVPLAVDLERFDPARLCPPPQMRLALGLPQDGPLLGIVGRLQTWKGMHTLIEALPTLLETHPRTRAVIVGGPHSLEADYALHLQQQIVVMGLQERVRMVGSQSNIPEWMQAMDVVVHASDREPFGIVVLEGMALGKPMVAGAEGGPREIITPGIDGLLAPFGDAPALAAALLRYLDNPLWAQEVGAAARQRALEFSTPRYAQRVIEAVRELADGSSQP